MSFLYRLSLRLLRRFGGLLAPGGSKLSRGIRGRRSARDELVRWGTEARDPNRPTVWFHAPSVGEGLQAAAVIDALRARRPPVQIVFTYFSPSAEALGGRIGADVATYLPWDLSDEVDATLEALRPELLVFTKTEVWPVLAAAACDRGVRLAIVGASVPEGAGRMRGPARRLLGRTWRSMDAACAISPEDAERLAGLGVEPGSLHTTGDPGIDSASQRARAADEKATFLAPFHADPRPTLVAGSTWPPGEDVLIPALSAVRFQGSDVRVIVAPHEPTDAHVEKLLERFGSDGWRSATLSKIEEVGELGGHDAIVVDSVGRLAHLYTVGDIAYVGGGYHDDGLHSVLEPAAAGVPVLFGPRHSNSRAAADLLVVGGAKIASHAEEMQQCIAKWLRDDAAREAAGKQAFRYIDDHRGAADRTAEILEALMETQRPE